MAELPFQFDRSGSWSPDLPGVAVPEVHYPDADMITPAENPYGADSSLQEEYTGYATASEASLAEDSTRAEVLEITASSDEDDSTPEPATPFEEAPEEVTPATDAPEYAEESPVPSAGTTGDGPVDPPITGPPEGGGIAFPDEEPEKSANESEPKDRNTPEGADMQGTPGRLSDEWSSMKAEARMLALAEPNPVARLELLQALIVEGDIDMASFALGALQEQPDAEAGSPEHANTAKVIGAQTLVEILASRELFEDAENVVDLLGSLDQQAAITSVIDLLRKGYAGPDNAYLHLDFTEFIQAAHIEGQQPRAVVFRYLSGLAAYGVDLFDHETEAGRLMLDSIAAVPEPIKRDYYYNSIAYSFADGGHGDKAVTAKDRISDPYWRSSACVQLARIAQNHNDTSTATTLISEARELLTFVSHCEGSCGRNGCNSSLDTREIEIGIALVFAKQGQQAPARELVGTLEPAFAYDQALVRADLYKTGGDMNDRAAALAALTNCSVFQRESLAGAIVTDIGTADWRWGNIMPSLDADGEAVPLICWELHSLYAEKHDLERKLEVEGLDEEGYRGMELLGIDPSKFLGDIAKTRGQLRDHGLAVLTKLLVSVGAPKTAKSLLGFIETPVEKVRAMSALGALRR